MPIVQVIDNARAERVAEGVQADTLAGILSRSSEALDWLRARHADHGLPLLYVPAQRHDIQAITEAAERSLKAGGAGIRIDPRARFARRPAPWKPPLGVEGPAV